jgi:sugar/nucleoside kinase (ribokinase family)
MKKYDVLAIGNAIVDIISHTSDDFLIQNEIVKGAMTLIDRSRAEFLYHAMEQKVQASGGSAGNTSAAIASLGGKTAYIGKVSDDSLGDFFRSDMQNVGVEFTTPALQNGNPTALSMIFVSPDGERSMNTYLGSCAELTQTDIDEEQIAHSKITYFEGYLWDAPEAKQAIMRAAHAAHKAQNKVAMTLSDKFCVDRYRDEFLTLIRSKTVDIMFANEHELMSLYETSDINVALSAVRHEGILAAITLSDKGSVIISHDKTHEIAAMPVEKVIDTTGAGDLYAAGVLFGITHGYDLTKCGQLGSLCASTIIAQIGSRPHASLRQQAAHI